MIQDEVGAKSVAKEGKEKMDSKDINYVWRM